ncbi:aminotransferase class III-fold pyridoxal phosphate-dependent enzyme [Pseudomaricurvus alkylphenolicus]|uniref:aminotransferase class III-fold pyridoxal phosphate-dependent enzyme n=1 Tax=Pseudomaricurvus alkylphenolicus TaxID=1306991 RepID=UPI001422705B|nr:aminotransferase class III-fold pyridoxal phosphate-dependent enzyme [Pseudomaricurvus alkylphenolicus]NIB41652.1 aminotransferase class III-fold pyridoxal phosphate-dependent enzyme [Pseudomaricurvus alkylphenolicus]
MAYTLDKDKALRMRAESAFPAGIYGHMSTKVLPDNYPQFIAQAEGGRLWGVDGYEYIDFLCAYGPNILGYKHPKVEAAVRRQMEQGDCTTGPSPVMVELAEKMIEKGEHADWSLFCKNGSDATTICLMIARAQTGRNTILMAEGTYHGVDPWCSWSKVGITEGARANIITFTYNDVTSLEQAVADAGDDLAGIILTPNMHEVLVPQQIVKQEFAQKARQLCDDKGAALILDDVRCSYRFSLGCTWQTIGVLPDLCAMGKTLGNGYALSAVTGNNKFRSGAAESFTTGSYWFSSVAFAASLATIEAIEEEEAIPRMESAGRQLREGLADLAHGYGFALEQSGPVQMPLFLFKDDPEFAKGISFCNEAVKNGVYLHPVHNMFVCAAHDTDIVEALDRIEGAFKALKREFGDG